MTDTEKQPSKAARVPAEVKARETDVAAKSIIAAETKARDEKSERLRALRLAQDTAKPADAPKRKQK